MLCRQLNPHDGFTECHAVNEIAQKPPFLFTGIDRNSIGQFRGATERGSETTGRRVG